MISHSNFNLKEFNSYSVSSVVKTALFPESINEIVDVCKNHPNAIIIGSGNNIIFSKPHYDATFIFIRENLSKIELVENNSIIAYSGCSMQRLSEFACENSITGFESFFDIPGSIGGGIYMNAGNDKNAISDNLIRIWAYNIESNTIDVIEKNDCEFSYRNSLFKQNNKLVILKSLFSSQPSDQGKINDLMLSMKSLRFSKQPREYPNAGSVFKRPEGYFTGTLIESLNLKGYSIGDAQISEKHAGFIINRGKATGEDIIALISHIQSSVYNRFGVRLQLEQIII